jgi:hypothetical protein
MERVLPRRHRVKTSHRVALLAALAGIACAAEAEDGELVDDVIGEAQFDTPDPNNRWTKGVDLSKLAIGEETVLPEENALFDAFSRDVTNMQDRLEASNRRKMRGFHAKAHGCVLGELHVSVPEALPQAKVGLFKENKTFPTWLRYSNGTGFVQSDKRTDVRGAALKIIHGGAALRPELGTGTQDIVMTNGANTLAYNAEQFVAFGKALTDARVNEAGEDVGILESLQKTGGFLFRPENSRVLKFLVTRALPRVKTRGSMLSEQFWSGGAIAMGVDPMTGRASKAAKITAIAGVFERDPSAPNDVSKARCRHVRDIPNPFSRDKSYLRTNLIARMSETETCLDLRIQFQNHPSKQPMEDTSVEWRERDAPFTSIGFVVIPRQNPDAPETAARENFCNDLAFTPWHTLPEHRPLGNMMRARLPVYRESAKNRGAASEPTGNETF